MCACLEAVEEGATWAVKGGSGRGGVGPERKMVWNETINKGSSSLQVRSKPGNQLWESKAEGEGSPWRQGAKA